MRRALYLRSDHLFARAFFATMSHISSAFLTNNMKRLALLSSILLLVLPVLAQREHPNRPTVTGAPLIFEQSCYDVQSYDISIKVDVAAKSISGTTVMKAKVVIPTNAIMLDLDTPYTVSKV